MTTRHLLLFTRYPEAGKVKTRLIPALGAAGAAALQRDLTAHMLRRAGAFSSATRVHLVIWYDGGPAHGMPQLFGREYSYRPQPPGDLGQRLVAALTDALAGGGCQVLLIGSDCPEISGETLSSAFFRLTDHDLVLGPARDGGYYLIGLKKLNADLFQDISWGTTHVLAQTLVKAENSGLKTALLEPLTDIDRPEDLPVWETIVRRGENL